MSKKKNESYDKMNSILSDDSYGLMPSPLPAQDALHILADYLLGDDFYIVDPVGVEQGNTIITKLILDKYSKQWREDNKREKKKWSKKVKLSNT